MDTETQLAFKGTAEEQELAARAFDIAKRKGMLFGANAPIKITVDNVAKTLTKEGGAMAGTDAGKLAPRLEAALSKNSAVFARGDAAGEFVTTKSGHAYQSEKSQNTHTFRERLNNEATTLDADAAKEYASSLMNRAANRAERTALIETIVEMPSPGPMRPPYSIQPPIPRSTDMPTLIPRVIPQEEAEGLVPQRQPEPAPPPAAPVTPAASAAPAAAPPTPRREEGQVRPAAPTAPATPAPVAPTPAPQTRPAPVAPPVEQAQPSAPVAATPAPAPQAPVEEAPVAPRPAPKPVAPTPAPAPVITGPVEVRVQTAEGPITVDLRESVDDILANQTVAATLEQMVATAIASDSRLITFGSELFPEEATERFSKGDFRRIKEYLDEPETGGVASDRDIMADVLNRRADHPDYERMRFSLDYRLLKEKKDFEFVGIDSDRLWINAGSSPVPPPARKPAELGQDYRYLEDPAIASVEEEHLQNEPIGPIEHSLTYYEYENGVLPYDLRFKRIFPGAVFEDQRSSLLRFEIPQLYGALLAELRYPTGNRGGFIMGLSELFTEHMVPGAKFSILPTDRGEDVFEIHFDRIDEREENLLQFDERKGRYVFRPVSFTVETDPATLLSQEKFGKLQNQKKMEESERRRPDQIIINAFEVVGDNVDGKFWAIIDDLYPVVNIERPISRSWLTTLLSGAYPFFYPDETTEGAYFYDPTKKPS